jgi:head-tail adaptor
MAGISLTVEGTRDFKDNWRVIARKAGATVKGVHAHNYSGKRIEKMSHRLVLL